MFPQSADFFCIIKVSHGFVFHFSSYILFEDQDCYVSTSMFFSISACGACCHNCCVETAKSTCQRIKTDDNVTHEKSVVSNYEQLHPVM